jgi:hypothetical protein
MSAKIKLGQLVSVWQRDSARHKWLCEYSMVRVLRFFPAGATHNASVLVQTSRTGQQHRAPNGLVLETGPTSMALNGVGRWQRELRKPVWRPLS